MSHAGGMRGESGRAVSGGGREVRDVRETRGEVTHTRTEKNINGFLYTSGTLRTPLAKKNNSKHQYKIYLLNVNILHKQGFQ